MKYLLPTLLLTALGLAGCEKEKQPDLLPCTVGTLLGTTCEGDFLIQLDTVTALHNVGQAINFVGDGGTSLPGPPAKLRIYNNVISTYMVLPANMQRGHQFFFQYKPAPSDMLIPVACPTNSIRYQTPRYQLLNISDTNCPQLPE